ncbi:MAG TPA: helix-turn-helix transcriptional regulator [Bryobacteraceae bacterium]|nr:helix-turn-helix transcriptional regulator [Bryobacteraceae bacterium]
MPDPHQRVTETTVELTSLIYESVTEPSRWAAFLAAFVKAVHADKGNFAIRDVLEPGFSFSCSHGWAIGVPELYAERFAAIDPWRTGSANWPESAVGTDIDLCSREEMESSVAYREFYLPNDAVHGLGGTVLLTSAAQSLIIAVRGVAAGPFGETEKAVLRPLMPHLKRAALLHGEFHSLRRKLAIFTDHLDRYSHALYLTDPGARVLYANAAAREVSASSDGLSIRDGRLAITSSRQDAAFRRAVSEIATVRGAQLRRIEVSRHSGGEPYRLILMPVGESGEIPMGVSMPAVSILVVAAGMRPTPDVPVLCELFLLTPAEARVAGKLALGQSVEEIAAAAKISVGTVRTHLKRTLAKTGTTRQGELISLILRSVPGRRP